LSWILILEQSLNGLQFGLMLFLLAAGLTLVFGIMDMINLAHGSLYMLGAFIASTLVQATGSFVAGVLLALPATATSRDLAGAIATTTADVVFLDFFVDEKALRSLYAAADGVLANSEREPFGLVGLEVMASGGLAYVGRTGEDYAVPFGNAIVVQSDDPRELLTSYLMLRERPELARSIRTDGRATAKRFAWPRILEGYESVWETAFALTS